MRGALSVAVLFLLSACQPQATRLLLLDLALSEPAVLNSTARPWREEGYRVEYRRFYPHLARADLERYGTLIFLLGREPEAPSDALNTGDLALLTEWVLRGGVVVLAYDADGEGYLDRWTANRWLEFVGAGISVGDRLLEDTTGRVPTTTEARLIVTCRMRTAGSVSGQSGSPHTMPALLCSTSTPPKAPSASSSMRAKSSGCVTSTRLNAPLPPSFSIRCTVS